MQTVIKSARQLLSTEVAILLNGSGVNSDAIASWNGAKTRICADGALKKVREHLLKQPTHVVGDFDSIDKSLLSEFEKGGGIVKHVTCQNSTDFQKCLKVVEEDIKYSGDITVCFGLGGRRDHEHLNLRLALNTFPTRLILVGTTSILHPLQPGINIISVDPPYDTGVGILPLIGPTTVSTKGLKWNLDNALIGYDESLLWTSSNEAINNDIQITIDRPVLWTVSLTGS